MSDAGSDIIPASQARLIARRDRTFANLLGSLHLEDMRSMFKILKASWGGL